MATATRHNPVRDASNGSVRVEIFDQAYNLRGSDADYIIWIAECGNCRSFGLPYLIVLSSLDKIVRAGRFGCSCATVLGVGGKKS